MKGLTLAEHVTGGPGWRSQTRTLSLGCLGHSELYVSCLVASGSQIQVSFHDDLTLNHREKVLNIGKMK